MVRRVRETAEPSISPALALIAAVLTVLVAWGTTAVEQYDFTRYTLLALAHGGFYLGAVWWVVQRGCRPRDLLLILLGAVLLRGLAVMAPLHLTTDALRYVWDGRIQAAGFNPYLYVPPDERLEPLRDAAIYPHINQKETALTIYPPMAQMIFLLATRIIDGIEGMKLVMLVFEAATVAAVMLWLRTDGLPLERVVVYAWHPLPIWEFASQAHIDAAATALLVLAIVATVRGHQGWAGVALAGAALVKYFPAVLIPAVWRRWNASLPIALAVTATFLYVPYWVGAGPKVLGSLFQHLDREGYTAGDGFHVIWLLRDFASADLPGKLYITTAALAMTALAVIALVRRRADEIRPEHLVMLGAAFVWLTSPHYPWYFAWLIPLLARHMSPAVLVFTLLSPLYYLPSLTWSAYYLAVFGTLPLLLAIQAAGSRK